MKHKQIGSVSVVIPCYNEELIILECLHALLAQTERPDEIIVVDNNSTDATAKLAASVPEVTVIKQPIQGIAWARNAGFDAAKSDVIARIDADTIVPPDWIAQIKSQLSTKEVIGVSGPAQLYDHPYGLVADFAFNNWNKFGNKFISGSAILWGSNMAFTRAAWQVVRTDVNNDSYYWEDIDLSMRLHKLGSIKFDSKLLVRTSARSSIGNPIEQIKYFAHWPRTYSQFGWRPTILSLIVFSSLVVWLPLSFFVKPALWWRESSLQSRIEKRLRTLIGV